MINVILVLCRKYIYLFMFYASLPLLLSKDNLIYLKNSTKLGLKLLTREIQAHICFRTLHYSIVVFNQVTLVS